MTRRLLAALVLLTGCTADLPVSFQPEPDDEAVDPSDPPIDPDPADATQTMSPEVVTNPETEPVPSDQELAAMRAQCPAQTRTLSPGGLTFAIHISKKDQEGWDAVRQLHDVRKLIRARDIFVIERDAPWVRVLRRHFPCNEFHYIAYPEELDNAFAAAPVLDGIIVDWEGGQVTTNPQSFTVDKLTGFANKIHGKGLAAGVAPAWPRGFDDGHIEHASKMNFDLAQIQGSCADGGAERFAANGKSLVQSFLASGESPRNLGVEISLDSFSFADNHSGLALSTACARKAYGHGVRAIYIYGNGPPQIAGLFRNLRDAGLRDPR